MVKEVEEGMEGAMLDLQLSLQRLTAAIEAGDVQPQVCGGGAV